MLTSVLPQVADLLVVGGGINGAGIARDAAGRGLRVLLVEREDLAQHTSSASTKLIHGGLRYLEYGEFRLVREALIERERLWRAAPHIIWPLEFVAVQAGSPRPAWQVQLGLWLYDHLGGRRLLPPTRKLRLRTDPRGEGLRLDGTDLAFAYADCWVEDSRLVALAARDAANRGAQIHPRTAFLGAVREGDEWLARVQPAGAAEVVVRARALVNAAGPWVAELLGTVAGAAQPRALRLIKGSHIVLPQLYPGEHAFLLQNPDRRVVFVIPYEQDFSLVGTTDEAWQGAPGPAQIDAAEVDYLLGTVTRHFTRPMAQADVVWSYAGIRPLHEDHAANAAAVTRDYALALDRGAGAGAPLLSVYGGKITTHRRLAEAAMARLAPFFPAAGPAWTADAALPGGDFPAQGFAALVAGLNREYPEMPPKLLHRWARAYGMQARLMLGAARCPADLGEDFGGGLFEAEVEWLVRQEWAQTAEDVLMRRSKLLLHAPPETAPALEKWFAARG